MNGFLKVVIVAVAFVFLFRLLAFGLLLALGALCGLLALAGAVWAVRASGGARKLWDAMQEDAQRRQV